MVSVEKANAQIIKTFNLSLHVLLNMVKITFGPHLSFQTPWSYVNVSFADFVGNRNKFSFLQTVAVFSIS